jgi:hypothetical protein
MGLLELANFITDNLFGETVVEVRQSSPGRWAVTTSPLPLAESRRLQAEVGHPMNATTRWMSGAEAPVRVGQRVIPLILDLPWNSCWPDL